MNTYQSSLECSQNDNNNHCNQEFALETTDGYNGGMPRYKIHWTDFPLTYNLEEQQARKACEIDHDGFLIVCSPYPDPLNFSITDFYCPSEVNRKSENNDWGVVSTHDEAYQQHNVYPIHTSLIKCL